jgi:hypothetical protein
MKIVERKALYNKAKSAKVGEKINCPGCRKQHEKTTYHKVFCSNAKTRGRNNCKDNFWNKVDPEKRCRNTEFFKDVILQGYSDFILPKVLDKDIYPGPRLTPSCFDY